MRLENMIIAIMIFSVLVITAFLGIVDLNENYDDVDMSTEHFSGVFNATEEVYNISQDMKEAVLGGEIDDDNTENSMFKGAYASIRFVRASFGIIGSIMEAVAIELGIPAYFLTLGLGALAISVIFAIVYLVFRFKPQD
jgi:hypothetical protein